MNFYLNKYGFQPPQLTDAIPTNVKLIVVIPCFHEPDLIQTLQSLYDCQMLDDGSVEVITVINSGEHHSDELKQYNHETLIAAQNWAKSHQDKPIHFYFIHSPELPKKHAGVGLARKIGMDEAVYRFEQIKQDGVIVCFDADASCTPNYLVAIDQHFKQYPKSPGAAIHYEHPISGTAFSERIYRGIISYELHLRYYNQCLNYCGLPYAFHTVGSSMAVRSSAYQKQGGMNKRKAGEDFYFIHKIIALGNFSNINATKVIPSPRISDRVPFGTGKAIGEWCENDATEFQTYAFATFEILKTFVSVIPLLEKTEWKDIRLNISEHNRTILNQFLDEQKFEQALLGIRKNASNSEAFIKRFFTWLDAFKVLKWVHFFRDNGFPNQPILKEVNTLFRCLNLEDTAKNEREQLIQLREFEKIQH